MSAPRRPRLVQTSKHSYTWAWPDDAENVAEDERIAEVYHEQRMRERAEYARKRADYLAQVERAGYAEPVGACPICGDTVATAGAFCSEECAGIAASQPRRVTWRAHGTARSCPVCTRPIPDRQWGGSPQIYCSRKCSDRAKNRRRLARKHARKATA